MKYSKLLIKTSKNYPNDAVYISHKLLIRAGYIKQLTSGIYQYSPLFQKVCNNVTRIIKNELDLAGFQEVDLCQLQPIEIFEKSKRAYKYLNDKALFNFKDRNDKTFCLAPTAEESAVELIRDWVVSYKQLPISIYQINNKFRDEIRPYGGLIRSKMFLMKDAYSFAKNQDEAFEIYQQFKNVYMNILKELGLEYVIVKADSGDIGGNFSEEFHILCDLGKDKILIDDQGNCFNSEVAQSKIKYQSNDIKIYLYKSNQMDKNIIVMVGSSRFVNDFKLAKELNVDDINLSNLNELDDVVLEQIFDSNNSICSFDNCIFIIDQSLTSMGNIFMYQNKYNNNVIINISNIENIMFCDIDKTIPGDMTLTGNTYVSEKSGIEVGHIFLLGDKYSKSMNLTFNNFDGELLHFIMGCYGIGVSRLIAAYIEQKHDERGIIWDGNISPFIFSIIYGHEDGMRHHAEILYNRAIEENISVLLDDRQVNIGTKIKDSDLIGIPYKVIIGKGFIDSGIIEVEDRFMNKHFAENFEQLIEIVYGNR